MSKDYRLAYYPWITQHVEQSEIRRNISAFADILAAQLTSLFGETTAVQVLDPLEVPSQVDLIVEGKCDIALMNPLGYVFAHQRAPSVEVAAVALRIIDGVVGNTYYAQLYTHVDTGIDTIEQARGHSVGFGTPFSTSNFLIPAYELKRKRIHPLAGFKRIEFVGGHGLVAKAVYKGEIELGAGHDGVIIDLANQSGYSDAKDKLNPLLRSEPIPSDPIALNVSDVNERQQVQKALVEASKEPAGQDALAQFWGNVQGLEPISHSSYEPLSDAIQSLALTESDCLR